MRDVHLDNSVVTVFLLINGEGDSVKHSKGETDKTISLNYRTRIWVKTVRFW